MIFVGFYIFIESLERILEPQIVYSEKMFWVAIIGLVINLVGLLLFHDHAHLDGPCTHSHGTPSKTDPNHSHKEHSHENHDHKHNHKENHNHECLKPENHDHSHYNHKKHEHSKEKEVNHNENFYGSFLFKSGVFLHILADTLGSVGVIASYFVIQKWQFYIFDPISSFVISILIFLSVYPLLKQSVFVLILHNDTYELKIRNLVHEELRNMDSIKEVESLRIFTHLKKELHILMKISIVEGAIIKDVKKSIKKITKQYSQIKEYTIEIDSNSKS